MKSAFVRLKNTSAGELVAKAFFVETQMAANVAIFPTPTPTVVALTTARKELEAAIAAATDGGKTAHFIKQIKRAFLASLLILMAAYVTNIAAGDEVKIRAAGMESRSTPAPIGPVDAPKGLLVHVTAFTGQVKAQWDPVHRAHAYQLYINDTDPNDEGKWRVVSVITRSDALVDDLKSGAYWFRVNAVGAAGVGPMSDVANCKVA